jgi:hypothetical protein
MWNCLCVICVEDRARDLTHTTGEREYTREEMREACRNNYNAAVDAAASVCADAAIKLLSGVARVNQVDRHTAEVLRLMEKRILALTAYATNPSTSDCSAA